MGRVVAVPGYRRLQPGAHGPGRADGLPARPGPAGRGGLPGYSPLVQLPDGTVVNAPHIANLTGKADKALSVDTTAQRVTLQETPGFQGGDPVLYLSTDASDAVTATLENATYAPKLNAAPRVGDGSGDSSRAGLAAFVNGQTGATNPQRRRYGAYAPDVPYAATRQGLSHLGEILVDVEPQ